MTVFFGACAVEIQVCCFCVYAVEKNYKYNEKFLVTFLKTKLFWVYFLINWI